MTPDGFFSDGVTCTDVTYNFVVQKEPLCSKVTLNSLDCKASGTDHHTVEMCIAVRISISDFFVDEIDTMCAEPMMKRATQIVIMNRLQCRCS